MHAKGAGAAQTLAGLYAAKEASAQGHGRGHCPALARKWKFFTVPADSRRSASQGVRRNSWPGMGGGSFLLTITHEGDTAAAAALWQA